ncbi:MAG: hypothetical protein U1F11_12660 [Steroidobacteraceae bacterium]
MYFDSVTMFIFLLLLGRYFEMKGRHQAASTTDALARALPASVERLRSDGSGSDKVALGEVRVGDRLLIGSGQVVPVDGRIVQGEARVDESLVTGESMPQQRARGEALLGGSLNVGAAVTLEVVAAPLIRRCTRWCGCWSAPRASGRGSALRPSAWPRGSSCASSC